MDASLKTVYTVSFMTLLITSSAGNRLLPSVKFAYSPSSYPSSL